MTIKIVAGMNLGEVPCVTLQALSYIDNQLTAISKFASPFIGTAFVCVCVCVCDDTMIFRVQSFCSTCLHSSVGRPRPTWVLFVGGCPKH